MKKQVFAIMLFALSGAWQAAWSQCTWVGVPTGTTAASTSTNTLYSDIGIDANNTPYIVYCDGANSNLATVRTFSSGAWQTLGSTGNINASYTTLALQGTTPYIAFSDGSAGGMATVKTYTSGNWLTVGSAVSTGSVAYTSIAVDAAGTPYVAYQDIANGNRPTVKTFTAGAWALLGGTTASTVSAAYTSLALDATGTPYVIYQDVTNGYKTSVKKYSAGSWVSVGAVNISTTTATYQSIAFDAANTPYIAYEESNLATIKTFTAGAWQAVGTGTVANAYQYLNLAIDKNTNTPYITFYQTGSYGAATSKYSGGVWSYAGNQPFSTSSTTSYNAIVVDNNGVPYVVYNDYGVGAAVKLLGTSTTITLQPVPTINTCAGSNITLSVGTNTTSGLSYTWQYNAGSGFTNVAGGTAQSLSLGAVTTGQSGYLYRCIINDGCTNLVSNTTTLTVNALPFVSSPSYVICAGSSAVLLGGGAVTYTWSTGATTSSITVAPPVTTSYTLTGTDANGCVGSSVPGVTVNPNPTVTVANGSTCAGGSMTLSASGNATGYYWNTGATTSTLVVSPASTTVYTVTGTDANGCSTSTGVTVTVNPNPSAAIGPVGPVCSGGTISLTDNSTGSPIQWDWSGPNSYVSTLQNPSISGASVINSGIYSLVVKNSFGCSSVAQASVTVYAQPPQPAIASSQGTVCAGGTASLSATGSTSYTWSTGATGAVTTVTPATTSTYILTGADIHGCTNTQTLTILVVASKNISGPVTSTAGAVSGNVVLYRYSTLLSKWDSVAHVPFSTSYVFTGIDSSLYVVKAVPSATNMQVTYGPSAISWQGATVITHGCSVNATQPIQVQPDISVPAGTGLLAGNIYEGNGYGHKTANVEAPGNPIPGIVVKGGKNPGAAIFAQTTTDGSGHYAFANVPDNNPGETYFILVDIPGLDTTQTYHEVMTNANHTYTTLNFIVDSMHVIPVMATSVNELTQADYLVKLFPNPSSGYFTVAYSLLKESAVKLELLDLTGRNVQALQPASTQSPGDYKPLFYTGTLSPGVYFVKLSINGNEATLRLFITD